mmetsp:Transcript_33253/g.54123  ORF Transcript_33253/g.54123 Transcript_33253/m.54123 type:complete len:109 (-) Transcript_33253:312-638(-)
MVSSYWAHHDQTAISAVEADLVAVEEDLVAVAVAAVADSALLAVEVLVAAEDLVAVVEADSDRKANQCLAAAEAEDPDRAANRTCLMATMRIYLKTTVKNIERILLND